MSDTPDFDNMSPEEMMRWMESLAKRQGAAEGLTTDADMEVEEIDEADERLAGQGEYIPYGWTEERWREQQAKEAAEREARAAQEAQASPPETVQPEPEPEPEPAQPAASADGQPDFDNMSPEEMMRWMESLAKRQGASEGLTTDADMEVEEVDEADERLAGQGEYIPYGWTEERWREQQAKEAAEREARAAQPEPVAEEEEDEELAAALAGDVLAAPDLEDIFAGNNEILDESQLIDDDDIEYVDDSEEIYYELDEDEEYIDYSVEEEYEEEEVEQPAATADGQPDFDSMSPEEMMRWMESLAKRQGASEGLTTDADMEVAEVDETDERLTGQGEYIPYGWTEERWREQQAKEAAEREARASQQQPVAQQETPEPVADVTPDDVLKAPSFEDIFGANNELPQLDEEDEIETVAASADDPMSWLAGLSAVDEEDSAPDFDLGALESLSELGGDEAPANDDDPMSWLAGLAADPVAETTQADPVQDFELTGNEDVDGEGSLKWLESLAKRQGADEDELVTEADLDIPFPRDIEETGPGYAPYSFEEGTGAIQENDEPVANFDFDASSDPAAWLDSLASGVSGQAGAGEDYEADDEAEEEDYDSVASDVISRLNSGGEVSPEDIDAFFRKSFEKASSYEGPDYVFSEDEENKPAEPVAAEIPDWLQDQMASATQEMQATEEEPVASGKTDTSEMMIADLGLEDLDEEEVDIPDWLLSEDDSDEEDEAIEEPVIEAEIPDWLTGDSEDSGIIEEDIFADVNLDDDGIDETQIDTSDTWVAAFMEEDTGEMAAWYEEQRAKVDAGEIPDVVTATKLEAVDLPIESELSEGQPMAVPDWVSGDVAPEPIAESAPAFMQEEVQEFAAEDEDMSWLSTGELAEAELDMPDWLRDTVDDSVVTEEDALPEWLASDELVDMDVEEIPDWLRETIDDDEEQLALQEPDLSFIDFAEEEEAVQPVAPPQPEPTRAIAPARQSPAPVVPTAANIDVAAALASAAQNLKDGDLDTALQDYEAVIRANTALDQVESAMRKLVDNQAYKRNAAVHRVLGDTLMRQGNLQEALDTYRRALNML